MKEAGPEASPPERQLARRLSARQVQMIALGGTIGSGLFLGTGKSLANGGPASLLIAYAIVGVIVYLTMLALGEMAAYMPISGSFGVYATRFVNPPFGFAIQWNYWANDAISTAADLVAAQILIAYWNESFPGWVVSLIFWVFLIVVNVISVRSYGEMEYVLSLLKVATIIVFIILGICVNAGANTTHTYIGGRNWHIPGAPFVDGIGGFASVFVSASFAYGGTESIGITAGETANPARTIPRTVRNVFFRIVLFYILSLLIVGLNVPYDHPGLDSGDSQTSPFTIVFQQAGSEAAGSFINAVILTSVLSAGNHALYAGTRLLYSLGSVRQAPRIFSTVAARTHVPWVALLTTASISGLCFGSSFIGAGQLWTWLQNLVGVSNQLAWVAIGVASIRFRRAIRLQGKEDLLPYRNWTQPWGPWVVVLGSIFMILVQGWSAFAPWDVSSFFSYYVELLVVTVFYLAWCAINRYWFPLVRLEEMDLESERWQTGAIAGEDAGEDGVDGQESKTAGRSIKHRASRYLSWIF
jgi:amino acid transporter, AAT family